MVALAPRSTCSHCGSVNALDQRVAVRLPSTAADAGVPAFSVDEAVAGLPCDSSVPAARADPPVTTMTARTMATTRPRMTANLVRNPGGCAANGRAGSVIGAGCMSSPSDGTEGVRCERALMTDICVCIEGCQGFRTITLPGRFPDQPHVLVPEPRWPDPLFEARTFSA